MILSQSILDNTSKMISFTEIIRDRSGKFVEIANELVFNGDHQRRMVRNCLNQWTRSRGNEWSLVLNTHKAEIQAAVVFVDYRVDLRKRCCAIVV